VRAAHGRARLAYHAATTGDNRAVEIEQWWADGAHVPVALSDGEREIFVRRLGDGQPMTLLHGFPSSSFDWARVAPALAERHALLLLDFLGFGASEKPAEHEYSLHEQADIVEAIWAREGVARTILVAHDYAVSVAQELLARRSEGRLAVELRAVHLLNGGLYPDLHRRQPTQELLLDPEQGPRIGALLDEQLFCAGLQPTFAESYDATADSSTMWRAMARDGGQRISHLLARYMVDRERHEVRWVAALEGAGPARAFIWGMLDPISGAHMAERIAERLPDAPLLTLADVAHWPQLEAPKRVAEALLAGVLRQD
jgi:pimeloyl-ACP methyl ester carboxylesterase